MSKKVANKVYSRSIFFFGLEYDKKYMMYYIAFNIICQIDKQISVLLPLIAN